MLQSSLQDPNNQPERKQTMTIVKQIQPTVEYMKFVQHTDLAVTIIERLRQDETKKKAVDAYLERSPLLRHAWEAWDKIREIFNEDIYDGIFLWPNECDDGQLEEIANGCRDDQEKEFTKLVIAEYIILIAELNKVEGETVFIGVNW